MSSRFSIPVSLILLAAFLVFNVGMPVYFYLCPMMSDESPMCDVFPAQSSAKLSLTTITPDCCAKVFVADRKTTPFLKAADENLQNTEVSIVPARVPDILEATGDFAEVTHAPALSPPPLYLLNSTLLI
ncbi:MAG TPA: hypothetical protein VGA55_05805 [Bacteroidota bacterium]